jgi:hypothetical protein
MPHAHQHLPLAVPPRTIPIVPPVGILASWTTYLCRSTAGMALSSSTIVFGAALVVLPLLGQGQAHVCDLARMV